MKIVMDNKLEIKVFTYNTKEDRDNHILDMEKMGFTVKKSGESNMHPDSTVTSFLDEDNWVPFAEFSRQEEKKIEEPIYYETGLYFFNIYNPNKDNKRRSGNENL